MKHTALEGIVAEHIEAINAGDIDRTAATFVHDAYINDNRREFIGIDAIHDWVAHEVVSQKVTIDVHDVFDQYGDTVVRLAYDGAFDKTGLPEEIAVRSSAPGG
jgi:hypothetical protein